MHLQTHFYGVSQKHLIVHPDHREPDRFVHPTVNDKFYRASDVIHRAGQVLAGRLLAITEYAVEHSLRPYIVVGFPRGAQFQREREMSQEMFTSKELSLSQEMLISKGMSVSREAPIDLKTCLSPKRCLCHKAQLGEAQDLSHESAPAFATDRRFIAVSDARHR